MFITIGNVTQYTSGYAGAVVLANPPARKATAREAAKCLICLVASGDAAMMEASESFRRIYGNPYRKPGQTDKEGGSALKHHHEELSAPAEIIPFPNPAAQGMPRVSTMLRQGDPAQEFWY